MVVNPLERLGAYFILADFLGCHSVYSRGYQNVLMGDPTEVELKLDNARALCGELLDPLVDRLGPVSIGYGYISPTLSREIVRYQDPDKPSHHRWDLGAAADVCVHNWVQATDERSWLGGENAKGSPIGLGHHIHVCGLAYSRLITYSESPYVCLAVSYREQMANQPRKAFYENRFEGTPRAKPDYRTYSSDTVKARELARLGADGLPAPWQGRGYPTYHGGGREQYQHIRVSKYTMLSDWLLSLQSIASGDKNVPSMNLESVQDSIGAAGLLYDFLVDTLAVSRFSIVAGYVSHLNPHFDPSNDWRGDDICFSIVPPVAGEDHAHWVATALERIGCGISVEGEVIHIAANVANVYDQLKTPPATA